MWGKKVKLNITKAGTTDYVPPIVTFLLNGLEIDSKEITVRDRDELKIRVDFSKMKKKDKFVIGLPGFFNRHRLDIIEAENADIWQNIDFRPEDDLTAHKQQITILFMQNVSAANFLLAGTINLKEIPDDTADDIEINNVMTVGLTAPNSPAGKDAEENSKDAEENSKNTGENSKDVEENSKDAEENSKDTEENSKDVEENSKDAEENSKDADPDKADRESSIEANIPSNITENVHILTTELGSAAVTAGQSAENTDINKAYYFTLRMNTGRIKVPFIGELVDELPAGMQLFTAAPGYEYNTYAQAINAIAITIYEPMVEEINGYYFKDISAASIANQQKIVDFINRIEIAQGRSGGYTAANLDRLILVPPYYMENFGADGSGKMFGNHSAYIGYRIDPSGLIHLAFIDNDHREAFEMVRTGAWTERVRYVPLYVTEDGRPGNVHTDMLYKIKTAADVYKNEYTVKTTDGTKDIYTWIFKYKNIEELRIGIAHDNVTGTDAVIVGLNIVEGSYAYGKCLSIRPYIYFDQSKWNIPAAGRLYFVNTAIFGNIVSSVAISHDDRPFGKTADSESNNENNSESNSESNNENNSETEPVQAYQAAGSLTLSAYNQTNKEMTAGQFSFTLYETDADYYITENNDGIETVKNLYSGRGSIIYFNSLNYTAADNTQKYYVIRQISANRDGWTADENEFRIEVAITDDHAGVLLAEVTQITDWKGTPGLTKGKVIFNNYYNATGSLTLSAVIQANAAMSPGQFGFTIYETGPDYVIAEGGSGIETAGNQSAGTGSAVNFGAILYTISGNYQKYYVLKETMNGNKAWTVDPNEYHIEVTVTDDHKGGLSAEVTRITDTQGNVGLTLQEMIFTNTHNPTPTPVPASEIAIYLHAVKRTAGAAPVGGQFSFAVYEGADIVSVGTNTATGTIRFHEIKYTAAGRHSYLIKETSPAQKGWTVDQREFPVTINVIDNGNGMLTIAAEYPEDVVFNNVYTP